VYARSWLLYENGYYFFTDSFVSSSSLTIVITDNDYATATRYLYLYGINENEKPPPPPPPRWQLEINHGVSIIVSRVRVQYNIIRLHVSHLCVCVCVCVCVSPSPHQSLAASRGCLALSCTVRPQPNLVGGRGGGVQVDCCRESRTQKIIVTRKNVIIKSILCVVCINFLFPTSHSRRRRIGIRLLYNTHTHTHHLCIRLLAHYVYKCAACVCIMYLILFVRARAGAYTVTPIRHSTNFQDRCLLGRRNMMRNRRRRRPGARPTPLLIKPHVPPTRPVRPGGQRDCIL